MRDLGKRLHRTTWTDDRSHVPELAGAHNFLLAIEASTRSSGQKILWTASVPGREASGHLTVQTGSVSYDRRLPSCRNCLRLRKERQGRSPPQKVMLIRHAEKPVNPPPNGIDELGTQDKHSLIPRGWQRAGALVPLFVRPDATKGIARPNILYASNVGGASFLVDGEDASKSQRPRQTLLPLSQKLAPNVPFVTTFVLGQEADLGSDIKTRSGIVLVAWEHKHILAIVDSLPTAVAPDSWPSDRFDVVWVLDLMANGKYSFNQANQTLLSGDQ